MSGMYSCILHSPQIHVCPGNHDVDKITADDKFFQGYEHRFRMPRIQPPQLGQAEPGKRYNSGALPYPLPYEYGNAYYDFQYGQAHIVVLSAYSNMNPGSMQHTWLTETLQTKVNRNVTPWLLVMLHVPLYNTFLTHQDDVQVLKASEHLEPLFVQYKVNIVVSGHVHAYMRSKPVRFGQAVDDDKGPVYLIVGSSGDAAAPFRQEEPEDFVAFRDESSFGYGLLHIYNRTTAVWEWQHTQSHRESNRVGPYKNQTVPIQDDADWVILDNRYFL